MAIIPYLDFNVPTMPTMVLLMHYRADSAQRTKIKKIEELIKDASLMLRPVINKELSIRIHRLFIYI